MNIYTACITFAAESVMNIYDKVNDVFYDAMSFDKIKTPNTIFYIEEYMKTHVMMLNNYKIFIEVNGDFDYKFKNNTYTTHDDEYGTIYFKVDDNYITIYILRLGYFTKDRYIHNYLNKIVNYCENNKNKRLYVYSNQGIGWIKVLRNLDINKYNNIIEAQQKVINTINNYLKGCYKSDQCSLSFLLHGQCGTGKTSTAKLAALKLKLNFYKLCLDKHTIFNLETLLKGIYPNSIVLIDEFDKLNDDDYKNAKQKLCTILNDDLTINKHVIFIFTVNVNPCNKNDNPLYNNERITEIINF